MSAPLDRLVTPDLALLDAAIDDPPALGCEVAEGWDVCPKALRLTRLVQMVKSGELKMAARPYKAS